MTTNASVVQLNTPEQRRKSESHTMMALRRLRRDRLTIFAMVVLFIIALPILLAGPISTYILKTDPNTTNPTTARLLPLFSEGHILGTDDVGRDFASRLLHGGQVSLAIGVLGAIISLSIGMAVGLSSGYFGGFIDDFFNWVIMTLDSIPSIYLLLLLATVLTQSTSTLIIVIALTGWTGNARLVRAQTLQIRSLDYVLSAQALGASSWRIMFAHIMPNTLSLQFLVLASGIGGLILAESTLSFLKFGVQPPTATWGNMLSNAQQFFRTGPHMATLSGLMIFIVVLCLFIIGDGLRDAFDPQTVEK